MDSLAKGLVAVSDWAARILVAIAAASLVWLMLLLVGNVVLRSMAVPVLGAYEMASMVGIFVSGLALAEAQRTKSHVSIDILTSRLPGKVQKVLAAIVIIGSIALLTQLTVSLVVYGLNQRLTGAVTEALRLPFWPSVFLLAAGVAGLVLVLLGDLGRLWLERNKPADELTAW